MCRQLTWEVIPEGGNEGQGRGKSHCGGVSLTWPWLRAAGVYPAGPRCISEASAQGIKEGSVLYWHPPSLAQGDPVTVNSHSLLGCGLVTWSPHQWQG